MFKINAQKMSIQNLKIIALKTGASLDRLTKLMRQIDVNQCGIGYEVSIVRLAAIQDWLDAYGHNPFLQDDKSLLLEIVNQYNIWVPETRRAQLPSSQNRCLIFRKISKNPFYAAFCDNGDPFDTNKESWVHPFLAIYFLAGMNKEKIEFDFKKQGLVIRNLFDPTDPVRIKLKNKLAGYQLSTDQLVNVIEAADTINELDWVGRVLNKLGIIIKRKHKIVDVVLEDINERRSVSEPIIRFQRLDAAVQKKIGFNKHNWSGSDHVNTEGLAPSEYGRQIEMLVAKPDAECDISLQARKIINLTARDNQYIAWGPNHLNFHELGLIKAEIDNLKGRFPELAFLIMLSICCARPVREVVKIRVVDWEDGEKRYTGNEITLSPKNGIWRHPVFTPDHSFSPTEFQKQHLVAVSELVSLRLPVQVDELSKKLLWGASEGCRIGDHLDYGQVKAVEKFQAWIELLRNRYSLVNLTQAKLYNFGLQELLGSSCDPAIVAQIFWCDMGLSAQPYYAVYNSNQIQSVYAKTMTPILGRTESRALTEFNVGSKLLVKQQVAREWIGDWRNRVEDAANERGLKKIIEVHNCLTLYTINMLMFVTTHRDVSDPFESVSQFDSESKTAVLRDKIIGGSKAGRLVWLNEIAINQLNEYKKHLKGLASRIIAYDSNLGKRIEEIEHSIEDLPFFFFLRQNSKNKKVPEPYQITRSKLSAMAGMEIPMNWSRTFVRTNLVRMGMAAEYVDYQMGHVSTGQEFDSTVSILTVDDIRSVIEPALDELCRSVGWCVMSGLRKFKTKPSKINHTQIKWVLGSHTRYEQRRKNEIKFHEGVIKFVHSKAPYQWSDFGSKEFVKKLKEKYKNNRFSKALNIAKHEIEKQEIELDEYWPKVVGLNFVVRSQFNADSMKKLRAGRQNRELLDKWIQSIEQDLELDKIEWASMCIASAVLYGGLCKIEFVKGLLRSPIYALEGCLWAEMNELGRNKKSNRRWIFDHSTGLIYLYGLAEFKDFNGVSWGRINSVIKKIFTVKNINELARQSEACYRFEYPAYIAAYLTGDLQAYSHDLKTWLRMLTGKKFYLENRENNKTINRVRMASSFGFANPDYHEVRQQLNKMRKSIKTASNNPWEISRNDLITAIELKGAEMQRNSVFMGCFLDFILKIIKDGRKKPTLTISTIQTYFNQLARHLYEATWSIISLDQVEEFNLYEIYNDVLDFTTYKNRPRLASLLRDFHLFCEKQYGFPQVDFQEIEPRAIEEMVRTSCPTEFELSKNLHVIPLKLRVHQTLATDGRMRTQEIQRLKPSDINGDDVRVVSVNSVAGKKTKSRAGYRKILLPLLPGSSALRDISDFGSLIDESNLGQFGAIVNEGGRRALQQSLRDITGDPDLVTHSLRHYGVSAGFLRAVVPVEFWPPGFIEARSFDDRLNKLQKKIYFGAHGRTRRALWMEAKLSGHSHPLTTFASYVHCLDYVASCFSNSSIRLSYSALEKLTGESYENLRQMRAKNTTFSMSKKLLRKKLNYELVPAPAITSDLIDHAQTKRLREAQYPRTLREVLEIIRLHFKGISNVVISQRLDIDINCVSKWMENIKGIELFTGYKFNNTLLNKSSWLNIEFSTPGQNIDNLFCSEGKPSGVIFDLMLLFKKRFTPKHRDIYLADRAELKIFINTLERIKIPRDKLAIIVPKNNPLVREHKFGFPSLGVTGIGEIKVIERAVKIRSSSMYTPEPLGVVIRETSAVDSRYLLRDEIFLLLAATWCVVGINPG